MRGVCAVMIFYHHFPTSHPITESFGDCCVAFFFMLSGFVLTRSRMLSADTAGPVKVSSKSLGRFMFKRLARLYPLYFVTMLAAFALTKFSAGAKVYICDAAMVQTWIPLSDFYFSGNAPAWFVCDLMFFYCLFLGLERLLEDNLKKTIICFAVAICVYLAIVCAIPAAYVHALVYVFPLMQLPCFVMGMIVARLYCWHSSQTQNILLKHGGLLLITALSVWVLMMFAYPLVPVRFSYASYWWPITAVLLIALVNFERLQPQIFKSKLAMLFVKFGDVSLSFYLLHWPLINLYQTLLQKIDISLDPDLSSVICLAIVMALAFPCNYLFEKILYRRLVSAAA